MTSTNASLILIFAALVFASTAASAQTCPPGNSCFSAPLLCGNILNGYSTSTGPTNGISQPQGFCGIIENNQWIRFVACSPSVTLQLNVSSCQGTFTGSGLQAQIFQTADCQTFTPVSNCFSPGTAVSGTLVANGLTPGSIYYLMVDGWAGDICQYSVQVLSGVDTNPPAPVVQTPGSVSGDAEVCPGQTAAYSVVPPVCGSNSASGCPLPQLPPVNYNYTWNLPPGASIVGNPNSPNVNIVWGSTGGTVSVTATPTGNAAPCGCAWTCMATIEPLNVQVVTNPTQVDVLPTIFLCQGETTTVCGQTVSTTTSIQCIGQDCNNATLQPVVLLPTVDNDLGIKPLCNDECFVYNGESFCQTGFFERKILTATTCERVKVTIVKTEIDCYYPQPPILHPSNPTVVLDGGGSSSNGGVTYSWSGPGINAGNQTQAEPTVGAAGTYVVTVTDPTSGCTHTCEVIVLSQPHDCNLPAPPSNFCETAPIFCGNELDGFCSFTDDFAGEYPGNLGSVFCEDIQNSAWLKFIPCEDSVALQITPSECKFGFGIEASIFQTTDCQNFTLLSQCAQTDPTTPIVLTAANLTPGEQYFLFVDGNAGDFCRWSVKVLHGIVTEPVETQQVSPPIITGPTAACPGQIKKFQLQLPNCQVVGAPNCLLDGLAQQYTIKWFAPAGASIVGPENGLSCQVQFSSAPGGDVFVIVNSVLSANNTYCLAENGCGSFAKIPVKVDFPTIVLPKKQICKGETFTFCGQNFSQTLDVECVDSCSKTIQPIEVLNPKRIDLGTIKICPDDCYLFENQPFCMPGKYELLAQNNVCPDTTSFQIEVISEPNLALTAVKRTCDGFGATYRVKFDLTSGVPPYFVNGQPIVGASFQSLPIVSEQPYSFAVTHSGLCTDTTILVEGLKSCECTSQAGATSKDTLFACPGNTVAAERLGGEFLEEDDDYLFVLHGGSGTTLQNVIALDTLDGIFGFDPAKMTLGHTYYISYVVGNAIDGGYIDLNDRCLSVAAGQPVVFFSAPTASIGPVPTLDCKHPQANVNGSESGGSGVFQFDWTGPGGFVASGKNATVSQPGDYFFKISDLKTGCIGTATANVPLDDTTPGVSASGATLTCAQTTATLTANSPTPGAVFWWKNPAGDSLPGPTAQAAGFGFFKIFAKSPSNGCVSEDSVEVLDGRIFPKIKIEDVELTCAQPSQLLQPDVAPTGGQFAWTGPGGFTSSIESPTVSVSGTYVLRATEPTSGCSASDTVFVAENKLPPPILNTDTTLTCANPTLVLTASSSVSGVIFGWQTPAGDSLAGATQTLDALGFFKIFAENTENGCRSEKTIELRDGRIFPQIQTFDDTLTCAEKLLPLRTVFSPQNLDWQWVGPGSFASADPAPQAADPGSYALTVTETTSGCTASGTLILHLDVAPPGVSAAGATLTCKAPSAILMGSSPLAGAVFWWQTPAGDSLAGASLSVVDTGFFKIFSKNLKNGCVSEQQVLVANGRVFPKITTLGGSLTCRDPQLNLHTAAFPASVNFAWSGPNGFSETIASPTVGTPGNYVLTVTEPVSGCTSTDTAEVTDERQPPTAKASVSEVLTCSRRQVWMSSAGSSTGPEFIYLWWSANGFNVLPPDSAAAAASVPDVYTLLVTNTLTGCTASTNLTVFENTNLPQTLSADVLPPTCFGEKDAVLSVLNVVGGEQPLEFSLDGGAFGKQSIFAGLGAGEHLLTVRDANGCTMSETLTVSDPPEVLVDIGNLVEIDLGESLTLEAQTSIPFASLPLVEWWSSRGDTAGRVQTIFVTPTETTDYAIFVSDVNGCSDADSVRVRVNRRVPVYVPNVFSPDGDGINDLLTVYAGVGVKVVRSFEIYDRWGERLFATTDLSPNQPASGWDGKFRSKPVLPGVFVWVADLELVDGEPLKLRGDVAVVREK